MLYTNIIAFGLNVALLHIAVQRKPCSIQYGRDQWRFEGQAIDPFQRETFVPALFILRSLSSLHVRSAMKIHPKAHRRDRDASARRRLPHSSSSSSLVLHYLGTQEKKQHDSRHKRDFCETVCRVQRDFYSRRKARRCVASRRYVVKVSLVQKTKPKEDRSRFPPVLF